MNHWTNNTVYYVSRFFLGRFCSIWRGFPNYFLFPLASRPSLAVSRPRTLAYDAVDDPHDSDINSRRRKRKTTPGQFRFFNAMHSQIHTTFISSKLPRLWQVGSDTSRRASFSLIPARLKAPILCLWLVFRVLFNQFLSIAPPDPRTCTSFTKNDDFV